MEFIFGLCKNQPPKREPFQQIMKIDLNKQTTSTFGGSSEPEKSMLTFGRSSKISERSSESLVDMLYERPTESSYFFSSSSEMVECEDAEEEKKKQKNRKFKKPQTNPSNIKKLTDISNISIEEALGRLRLK